MSKAKLALAAIALLANVHVYAEEQNTYIDGSKEFLSITDIHRQAEAWATCAAVYEITAEILQREKPAQAKMFKERANGARIAVTMAFVLHDLKDDISQEKFDSLWAFSKLASQEMPNSKRTTMLADAEAQGSNEGNIFLKRVAATVETCVGNLESQQIYVDAWRDLAKSGLLELPEN